MQVINFSPPFIGLDVVISRCTDFFVMDKFLLADNPLRPENDGLWIVYTGKPVSFIQCVPGHVEHKGMHRHFRFMNRGVLEEWTLGVSKSVASDTDKEPPLNEAWHWFRAYLTNKRKTA